MTPDEIADLNQAAFDNLQAITDSLWNPMGGRPTREALAVNPNAPRMRHFKLLYTGDIGHGADLDGGANACWANVIGLVRYILACDEARAIAWIKDILRRAAPPSPQRPQSNTPSFRPGHGTRMTGRISGPYNAA